MEIIQCKDGQLEVDDWTLSHYLCQYFIDNARKWIGTHTKEQVQNELHELANK